MQRDGEAKLSVTLRDTVSTAVFSSLRNRDRVPGGWKPGVM